MDLRTQDILAHEWMEVYKANFLYSPRCQAGNDRAVQLFVFTKITVIFKKKIMHNNEIF